jgi:hypothetical protein
LSEAICLRYDDIIAKKHAHFFFDLFQRGGGLRLDVGGIGFFVLIEVGADFCGECKAGRDGQAYTAHFRKIGALAAQQVFLAGIAFAQIMAEDVDPFLPVCLLVFSAIDVNTLDL